jgi:DNA helicase HerA-like ATPase
MARQYIVDPPIQGDVTVGTEGDDTRVYIGQLAETGPLRRVQFAASQEFVTLIIGKRGSGKSHTLGVLLEGLATRDAETSIGKHRKRRAALLLDPMGNFWTTVHKVRPDGPEKVRKQFASLDGWNCKPEDVDVDVWIPAGFRTPNDPPTLKEFRVPVPALDAADIADLIGVNLVREPQGAALAEAYEAVTVTGWTSSSGQVAPKPGYAFADLIAYLDHLRDSQNGGDHQVATLRALIRSLKALERQQVFTGAGTSLTELLRAGHLSILMLPLRVGADLRRVISRFLIRRILREREEASQIRQRLDVEQLDQDTRGRLEHELQNRIPRSIVALDEAQELLGEEGAEAREALENFCLLGRNYGLSLMLATQRPTASAISPKVRSQVDLYFIHRLLTQDDIDVTWKNLLAIYPAEVRDRDRTVQFPELVRSLDRGCAIISASHARGAEPIARIVIARIRPRITVHGGETE